MEQLYPGWVQEPIRRGKRLPESPDEWRRMLDYSGKMPEAEAYRRLAEMIDYARMG
jgi:hypothetical protein